MVEPPAFDADIDKKVVQNAQNKIKEALNVIGKLASEQRMDEVKEEILALFPEEEPKRRPWQPVRLSG